VTEISELDPRGVSGGPGPWADETPDEPGGGPWAARPELSNPVVGPEPANPDPRVVPQVPMLVVPFDPPSYVRRDPGVGTAADTAVVEFTRIAPPVGEPLLDAPAPAAEPLTRPSPPPSLPRLPPFQEMRARATGAFRRAAGGGRAAA
jgi:hypothetical protein